MMSKKQEYWIDDDNYIMLTSGNEYITIAKIYQPEHIEPLTKILNSHDALLDACKKSLEFIGRSNKTDWNNEITPVLEAAIAQAEKEG